MADGLWPLRTPYSRKYNGREKIGRQKNGDEKSDIDQKSDINEGC